MEKENKQRERKIRHYPSSLCAIIDGKFVGKCRRATAYEMMQIGKTNVIDSVALFKMEMGNIIHDTLGQTLDRALDRKFNSPGVDEATAVEIEGINLGDEQALVWDCKDLELPVSGRIDKIVKFNGKIRGIVAGEWKSTYGSGVGYVQRDGAKPEHLLQCLAYLEQDIIPIDAIWLIYVARDSGYLYGFQIEKQDGKLVSKHLNSDVTKELNVNWSMVVEAIKPLEDFIKKYQKYIVENTKWEEQCEAIRADGGTDIPVSPVIPEPPARDYDGIVNPKTNKLMVKSPWQCRYCSYRSLCYGCEED